MFLRYRMTKLIRILENNDSEALNDALRDPQYQKALKALEDQGCVRTVKDWSGSILNVWLADHYATYQLSRQELWKNRIGGYIAGIISGVVISVISAIVIGLLPM